MKEKVLITTCFFLAFLLVAFTVKQTICIVAKEPAIIDPARMELEAKKMQLRKAHNDFACSNAQLSETFIQVEHAINNDK